MTAANEYRLMSEDLFCELLARMEKMDMVGLWKCAKSLRTVAEGAARYDILDTCHELLMGRGTGIDLDVLTEDELRKANAAAHDPAPIPEPLADKMLSSCKWYLRHALDTESPQCTLIREVHDELTAAKGAVQESRPTGHAAAPGIMAADPTLPGPVRPNSNRSPRGSVER